MEPSSPSTSKVFTNRKRDVSADSREAELYKKYDNINTNLARLLKEIDELDEQIEVIEKCATERTARYKGNNELKEFIAK
ncbi:unnamed protein product, partial [Mesorhabditis spiculigera]